jgi:hypothetical protein
MNTEEIYRAALEEMSANGNEAAKMALLLGSKCVGNTPTVNDRIISQLKSANSELQSALRANDREWTTSTDRRIADAQSHIVNAIALL